MRILSDNLASNNFFASLKSRMIKTAKKHNRKTYAFIEMYYNRQSKINTTRGIGQKFLIPPGNNENGELWEKWVEEQGVFQNIQERFNFLMQYFLRKAAMMSIPHKVGGEISDNGNMLTIFLVIICVLRDRRPFLANWGHAVPSSLTTTIQQQKIWEKRPIYTTWVHPILMRTHATQKSD